MRSCEHCEKFMFCPFISYYNEAAHCMGFKPIRNLTQEQFEKNYCQECPFKEPPFRFCKGVNSNWFERECEYRECLKMN